jgi:hypothetical protein
MANEFEKTITYFGKPMKVACDGKCEKAWGIERRPKNQLSKDDDDYEYLADHELGIAPVNPGTYEGCDGKPESNAEFMDGNRWCIRQCERCVCSELGKHDEPLELKDFSKRISNYR